MMSAAADRTSSSTAGPRKALAPHYDVVVVEDDAMVSDLLAEVFTEEGFRVATARNGREALDLLKNAGASVVVSDLMMPVMSGWELVKAMRATPALASLPVLFVTAVVNAHRVPAGPVFLKPLDLDSLVRAVRMHASPPVH
jgi:CheY-like chemotaxis protein